MKKLLLTLSLILSLITLCNAQEYFESPHSKLNDKEKQTQLDFFVKAIVEDTKAKGMYKNVPKRYMEILFQWAGVSSFDDPQKNEKVGVIWHKIHNVNYSFEKENKTNEINNSSPKLNILEWCVDANKLDAISDFIKLGIEIHPRNANGISFFHYLLAKEKDNLTKNAEKAKYYRTAFNRLNTEVLNNMPIETKSKEELLQMSERLCRDLLGDKDIIPSSTFDGIPLRFIELMYDFAAIYSETDPLRLAKLHKFWDQYGKFFRCMTFPNTPASGYTLLEFSIATRRDQLVYELVEWGINFNYKSRNNLTLIEFVENKRNELVKYKGEDNYNGSQYEYYDNMYLWLNKELQRLPLKKVN